MVLEARSRDLWLGGFEAVVQWGWVGSGEQSGGRAITDRAVVAWARIEVVTFGHTRRASWVARPSIAWFHCSGSMGLGGQRRAKRWACDHGPNLGRVDEGEGCNVRAHVSRELGRATTSVGWFYDRGSMGLEAGRDRRNVCQKTTRLRSFGFVLGRVCHIAALAFIVGIHSKFDETCGLLFPLWWGHHHRTAAPGLCHPGASHGCHGGSILCMEHDNIPACLSG
jgi:hypothetical protein